MRRFGWTYLLVGIAVSACMQRQPARIMSEAFFSSSNEASDEWAQDIDWAAISGLVSTAPELNLDAGQQPVSSSSAQNVSFQWAARASYMLLVTGTARVPMTCNGPLVARLPQGNPHWVTAFDVRLMNRRVNPWAYRVDPVAMSIEFNSVFCEYPGQRIEIQFLYGDPNDEVLPPVVGPVVGGGPAPPSPNPAPSPTPTPNPSPDPVPPASEPTSLARGTVLVLAAFSVTCAHYIGLDNGKIYRVTDLPATFRTNGLRVRVKLTPSVAEQKVRCEAPDGFATIDHIEL